VRKIKWNVARKTVFKSNLPNFNYDALCEDLENIIKSYENKDSGTCNMTERIVNEKVLEFSSFLFNAATNNIASRKITKNRSGAKKTKKTVMV
jgi:hypothetical protein